MSNAIKSTDFHFPVPYERKEGKVRDLYTLNDNLIILVATDRISAFDHILPKAIPYKGQVLNQIAAHFLNATKDIVPNYLVSVPDPNVSVGMNCSPFPVEMVVRGYLAGHAWRVYKSGKREICGVPLPEGLKENDKLPEPIITPTTKSAIGHDEDVSEAEILKSGLIGPEYYHTLKHYALSLFQRGTEMAAEKGLILCDTKYEFGLYEEQIYLIDEVHTPDSSRYFYADGYEERQQKDEPQKQLSKEFVRKWLMENGFQGLEGQTMPEMPDNFIKQVSDRYIELYEKITGNPFEKADTADIHTRVHSNAITALKALGMED